MYSLLYASTEYCTVDMHVVQCPEGEMCEPPSAADALGPVQSDHGYIYLM